MEWRLLGGGGKGNALSKEGMCQIVKEVCKGSTTEDEMQGT